jgi:hypothetical protein
MTRPAPWRRSTAAERRANRAAFAKLKAACEASPSPETQAYRAQNRRDDARKKVRHKLSKVLAGEGMLGSFTARELAVISPDELQQLRTFSGQRFMNLNAEQRDRLKANLYLLLVCFDDEQYHAIAAFDPRGCE